MAGLALNIWWPSHAGVCSLHVNDLLLIHHLMLRKASTTMRNQHNRAAEILCMLIILLGLSQEFIETHCFLNRCLKILSRFCNYIHVVADLLNHNRGCHPMWNWNFDKQQVTWANPMAAPSYGCSSRHLSPHVCDSLSVFLWWVVPKWNFSVLCTMINTGILNFCWIHFVSCGWQQPVWYSWQPITYRLDIH